MVGSGIGSRVMPVRISGNGRYFFDKGGAPFFWMGDTLWHLFRDYSAEEVGEVLRRRKEQGFNAALVMLIGYEGEPRANVAGDLPFVEGDPGRMNERYFLHVDECMRAACALDFVLVLGVYHKTQAGFYTLETARESARWIAARYRDVPQIVWSMYPEARRSSLPMMRALAAGLREGDGGRHMITVHPDPSPQSSTAFAGEEWISFHVLQAWRDLQYVHPMTLADYGVTPARPVVMAEGGYEGALKPSLESRLERLKRKEAGAEPGEMRWEEPIGAADIRRQAYWTYLAGGHHVYGHDGNHNDPRNWRRWMEAPGAGQLGVFRKIVTGLEKWWDVVPDQSLFARGTGEGVRINAAGRSGHGDWVMVYLSSAGSPVVRMDMVKIAERLGAWWISPVNGERRKIGEFACEEIREFMSPEGWEDAVLLLEGV